MLYKKIKQILNSDILFITAVIWMIIFINRKMSSIDETNLQKQPVNIIEEKVNVVEKKPESVTYKSDCSCREDELVTVMKPNSETFHVSVTKNQKEVRNYNISAKISDSMYNICGKLETFRRGLNLKVITYSQSDTKTINYDRIKMLSKQIKQFYPGWLMRVYHNSSLDRSKQCEVECLKDDNGQLLDVVDFCNPTNLTINKRDKSQKPVTYVLPRLWQLFTAGDLFVDFMMSRDLNSNIIQREVDAVNEWLKSDKGLHIMRDHPDRGSRILPGMWGLKLNESEALSNRLFQYAVDPYSNFGLKLKKLEPKGNFLEIFISIYGH